jgi:hypothetical protein
MRWSFPAPQVQPLHTMEKAGFIDRIGIENICPDIDAALIRAKEILAAKRRVSRSSSPTRANVLFAESGTLVWRHPFPAMQPGLHMHSSSRLEDLAAMHAALMRSGTRTDPLRRMWSSCKPRRARWLALRLADHLGCAMGVKTLFPKNSSIGRRADSRAEKPAGWTAGACMENLRGAPEAAGSPARGTGRVPRFSDSLARCSLRRALRTSSTAPLRTARSLPPRGRRGRPDDWQANLWRALASEMRGKPRRAPQELESAPSRRISRGAFISSPSRRFRSFTSTSSASLAERGDPPLPFLALRAVVGGFAAPPRRRAVSASLGSGGGAGLFSRWQAGERVPRHAGDAVLNKSPKVIPRPPRYGTARLQEEIGG